MRALPLLVASLALSACSSSANFRINATVTDGLRTYAGSQVWQLKLSVFGIPLFGYMYGGDFSGDAVVIPVSDKAALLILPVESEGQGVDDPSTFILNLFTSDWSIDGAYRVTALRQLAKNTGLSRVSNCPYNELDPMISAVPLSEIDRIKKYGECLKLAWMNYSDGKWRVRSIDRGEIPKYLGGNYRIQRLKVTVVSDRVTRTRFPHGLGPTLLNEKQAGEIRMGPAMPAAFWLER